MGSLVSVAAVGDGLATALGEALGEGMARPGLGDGTTDAAALGLGATAADGAGGEGDGV